MIYFDNAATGGFKPFSVTEAAINAMRYLRANPGRSGHRLSVAGAEIVYRTREAVCSFFNAETFERVIFTKNCTEALNVAIFGTVKKGGHVIVSAMEHNSVLRPLFALQEKGEIELTVLPISPFRPVSAQQIAAAIRKNTYLCCLSHAGNVTGDRVDLSAISRVLHEKKVLFLVDGAQSAGHTSLNMKKYGVDMLAVAGHKGLYAEAGIGALLFSEKVEISPFIYGGTGSMSFSPHQPEDYPDKLESGTLNLPAIASLLEGIRYLTRYMDSFSELLYRETERLCAMLSPIESLRLYSRANEFGIVAFEVSGYPSQEVANDLSTEYDIAVRGGYHCAPLLHKAYGTEKDGLVRVSLSPQNSFNEVKTFLTALKALIAKHKKPNKVFSNVN